MTRGSHAVALSWAHGDQPCAAFAEVPGQARESEQSQFRARPASLFTLIAEASEVQKTLQQ